MRVDGKFLAVDGKSNFDGTFTAVTQHDGKFLAVDGFPLFDGNFLAVDGNSKFKFLTVSRPYTGTVHQFGTFMSEKLPNTSLKISPRRNSNSRTNTSSIRGLPLVHRGDRRMYR